MADSSNASGPTIGEPGGSGDQRAALIALIEEFFRVLHPGRATSVSIEPTSRLERDLGIDSLARSELALRIERDFQVRLPSRAVNEAETVDDLAEALREARPRTAPARLVAASAALPAVPAAVDARTLPEVLAWHAERHADRVHVTVLDDDETVLGALTYGDLREKAAAVAAGLIERGVLPGDRVALMLPTGEAFFTSFMGILYAGAIPVPIYPPARLVQIEEHLRRQAGILRNAGAKLLVTATEARRLASLLKGQVSSLASVETPEDVTAQRALASPVAVAPDDVALIQYTSGSTGDPKGVVLSHANLLANIRSMGIALDASGEDVFVSWLPLYHDMGLIGAWMGCLYHAAALYVMPPTSFLARPASWLRAIHRYRATLSAAPNFAFDICARKLDDADLVGLDLGSLRMVANGSEPVSADTIRRFTDRFAKSGFRREAMAPVYGLAECAVGLAFPPLGRPPIVDRVDRDRLAGRGIATPAATDDPAPLEIVACGQPIPDHEMRVVDDQGREVADRVEGRLEFRGPSTTRGYHDDEARTRQLIRDGWVDSGDRAYVANGDVYVTGRIKDIIIRGGRNIHPQELEHEIGQLPGVRPGGVVAFGSTDPQSGLERLVVIAEARESDAATRSAVEARIGEVSAAVLGTAPDRIVLVPPRTVPKTSSGKLRRSAAKMLFEQNRLGGKAADVRWQIARLAVAGILGRARAVGRRTAEWLYACRWWTTIAVFYGLGWLAAMVVPSLRRRWAVVRWLARSAFRIAGIPVSVTGLDNIPQQGAVLVVNHASYSDAPLLAAFLPGEPVFVAKRELAGQAFAGPFLRRLGVVFVERYDVGESVADVDAVAAAARAGRLLVFFPEGTFTRRPGLAQFHLGAFKIAAENGVPVVPGVLRGTRGMLRSDQWFPLRTPLSLHVGAPIVPADATFDGLLALSDAARKAILAELGEPDIGELVKPEGPFPDQ